MPFLIRKGMIGVGDPMPLFELTDQHGNTFSIKELLGKFNLVVYFYPKDDTPGCTREAISFRDHHIDFEAFYAKVIGISSDSHDCHLRFATRHDLPFYLLSDPGNYVRKLFGVPPAFLGLLPGRVTYVVDKNGIVRSVIRSSFNPERHIQESLKSLEKIKGH